MSEIENKLNQLRSILTRIRYVRYGDYVYAEDHNLKVKALELIYDILTELKAKIVPVPIQISIDILYRPVIFDIEENTVKEIVIEVS